MERAILLPLLAAALAACAAPQAGAVRISGIDGMPLHYVPAGDFLMGSAATDPAAQADEMSQRTVWLAAFWIDETEVTNAQYRACAQAGACPPLVHPRPAYESEPAWPVQAVTWPMAVSYCDWAGRRLPTEAEWEKAARGADGRLYPWGGESPDETRANFDFLFGDVLPVGSFPDGASPYGALDMAGNVWEWVADWYLPDYFSDAPLRDPPGPDFSEQRGLRGGAWNTAPSALRAANRFWAHPYRNDLDGFRCAED